MVDEAVVVIAGRAFTVTVIVDVLEQPGPFEPVTVYVVVAAGVTVTLVPVSEPGIHKYVVAPFPVSVVLLPIQIDVLVAEVVTEG